MKYVFSMLISGLFVVAGTSVHAQQNNQGYTPPPAAQTQVDNKDVKAFEKVQPKIDELRTELNQKMNKTKEADRRELIDEYQEKMLEKVQKAGLTPEKYNAIAAQGGAR